MLELPEEVPTVATERTTLTPTPAVTSTIPTTSATTTITGTEAGSPRMFLPNGSPSRPTVTATCRPQTWVQRVSEGWTNVPPLDGTDSRESSLSETFHINRRGGSRKFRSLQVEGSTPL